MVSNPSNMSEYDFTSYLAKHGISEHKKRGDEVSFPCPFGGCDDDHRGGEEFHCSFNLGNRTYNCFKCGAKGNFDTLLKYFGDYDEYRSEQRNERVPIKKKSEPTLETAVRNAHKNTRDNEEVRTYFNGRGINNESIDRFMLGIGSFGGHRGFMIPVFNKDGKVAYVKLRRTNDDDAIVAETMGQKGYIPKYLVYPTGSKLLLVGEDELVKSTSSDVLICEGELDRIIAIQSGVKIPVVSIGGGAQTFKDEWADQLKCMRNIYICMDRDTAGESGFVKIAQKLAERIPTASIYKVTLPFGLDAHSDLTDYFVQQRGTAEELFSKYSEFYCGAKPIDPSKFEEMTVDDIANVLNTTIKYDYESKIITFLAMLLAYTDEDQLNIMFAASSSTGKSYICHEVSKYFPQQDVNIYGKTTPNAFYYSQKLRKTDEETGEPYIDLERRIMVFVEQPDTQLQANLRALLSHEKKRVPFAITNRSKSGRNTAEEGFILGFPSAFFCSANQTIDEQEQTRSIILSPDSSRKKVLAGIDAYIDKNCHRAEFDARLQSDNDRRLLMERILYIKSLGVKTIDVEDSEYLRQCFIGSLDDNMPPGAMRGIQKFTALAKAIALINAPFRTTNGEVVMTNSDVDEAMKLWKPISKSMVHNLSPQLYSFYEDAILPAWGKKNKDTLTHVGVTIKELRKEYYQQMGSFPNMENLRKKWLQALEDAEFIRLEKREKGKGDRRELLIVPLNFFDDDLDKKPKNE